MTSEILKGPTIATVTREPTKRKLEETLVELTLTLKSNTNSFRTLSKYLANKLNKEGASFRVTIIIDQNPNPQVQFLNLFDLFNPN